MKNGIWFTDFVENDMETYKMMVDDITKAVIKEDNIKQDKYGATYHVVKKMAHTLLACLLDSNGEELTLNWYYRKL